MLWFLLNMADFLTDIHLDLETSCGDRARLPWVVRPVETRVPFRSQSRWLLPHEHVPGMFRKIVCTG